MTVPPARATPARMPAVSSASDSMRRSSSPYSALRRDRKTAIVNPARMMATALANQVVIRVRIVSISRLHDVSDAPDRVDQLRLAAMVDLLAQPCDHDVDDVRSRIEVVVPGVLGDQGARHDATVMAHQVLQHRILLGGQLDRAPGADDFAAARVERQI